MATSPSQVRGALLAVTNAALADAQAVADAADTPGDVRSALFAATPLIVSDYGDGASVLALDWYDELREAARPPRRFDPQPFVNIDADRLASTVAWATSSLYDLEQQALRAIDADAERMLAQAVDDAMTNLLPEIQKEVAAGFWDTVTENTTNDPDAVGWQRFARGGACKFCVMLAGRGAVYTETTARFAAHTSCHCVAGPSFDPDAPRASVMQYMASKRTRTEKERADLRAYLNSQFPDAPG